VFFCPADRSSPVQNVVLSSRLGVSLAASEYSQTPPEMHRQVSGGLPIQNLCRDGTHVIWTVCTNVFRETAYTRNSKCRNSGDLEGFSSSFWGDKPLVALSKGLCSWRSPVTQLPTDGWQAANSLAPALGISSSAGTRDSHNGGVALQVLFNPTIHTPIFLVRLPSGCLGDRVGHQLQNPLFRQVIAPHWTSR
jgi:hypothetical protein